jgi:hypothetical protein
MRKAPPGIQTIGESGRSGLAWDCSVACSACEAIGASVTTELPKGPVYEDIFNGARTKAIEIPHSLRFDMIEPYSAGLSRPEQAGAHGKRAIGLDRQSSLYFTGRPILQRADERNPIRGSSHSLDPS